jgi:uncharacterized protein YxeA
MKVILIILATIIIVLIASQIYFSMAKTETQPYNVVKTDDFFEIRLYPPATMATIAMNAKTYKELSSSGFKKLASYIFGGNKTNTKMAMTTPVHMDINGNQSSMSFVMPANYIKENLPQPDDTAVKIKTSPEEYVAAIQFGGYANDEEIKKYAAQLESALKTSGIEFFGNFRYLGYSAPYQFLARKNEIIVNVLWNVK